MKRGQIYFPENKSVPYLCREADHSRAFGYQNHRNLPASGRRRKVLAGDVGLDVKQESWRT
jgi:hypothetical protein